MATTIQYTDELTDSQELHEDTRSGRRETGADDSLGFYLQDIGAIPLLTAAEEVELAKTIDHGRNAAQKLDLPLNDEERAAARAEVERGEAARRKMIESNLRLVVSIASRYNGRGLPLSDLIEEGNLGLIRATEKFDSRRGYRFSTYAVWWIRQAMSRALDNQSRTVRLPGHVLERLARISKATQKLTQELGREPTSEEVAREVGVRPEQVREAMKASQHTVSLEQPYGSEGDDLPLVEHIEDEGWAQTADEVSDELLREGVFSALRDLSDREQRVIALRYGLDGEKRLTLEEAGRVVGVTRERVRQIEKEAIFKLRQAGRCAALRPRLQQVA